MGIQDAVLSRFVRGGEDWTPVTGVESRAAVLRSPDGASFAKVVGAAAAEELAGERDRIEWWHATGLAGPAVLDWSSDDDGACLVMSAVPGVTADRLDLDGLSAVWPHLAETVRDIHEVSPDRCPFRRDLPAMMQRARDVVGQDRVVPDYLPQGWRDRPAQDLLDRLETEYPDRLGDERQEAVVCHGDLCLPNIVVDTETSRVSGFVDLGRVGLADPYADIALLLASAREVWPDEDAGRGADAVFATRYGETLDGARQLFYLELDPLTWYA